MVDLPGFKVEVDEVKPVGGRHYVYATNEESGVIFSVYFEPVAERPTMAECRSWVKQKANSQPPRETKDIKISESTSIVLVEFVTALRTLEQSNLWACLPGKDAYVDIHISSFRPMDKARKWHRAILDTARFEEKTEAERATEQADERFSGAWNNAAWLYASAKDPQLRNPQKALEYAKKAVELSGGLNAEHLDGLAEAYHINGLFDEAIEAEKKAIALLKPDHPAYKHCQEQLKKFEQAKRQKR